MGNSVASVFRHIILMLPVLTIMIGCTKAIDLKSESSNSLQLLQRGNGNGGHYGGKLENGIYVRTIPDSLCGTQRVGEIVVSDSNIISRNLDAQTCRVSEAQIELGMVDYALYSQGRVGLLEGLYTKPKAEGSSEVEEVWCRGEGSLRSEGFDVVIKADYGSRRFQAHVVTDKRIYAPINVSRDLDIYERARYRGGDFELDIRTNNPSQWAGTIQADLELGDHDYRLYCRLGGQLDRKSSLRPF